MSKRRKISEESDTCYHKTVNKNIIEYVPEECPYCCDDIVQVHFIHEHKLEFTPVGWEKQITTNVCANGLCMDCFKTANQKYKDCCPFDRIKLKKIKKIRIIQIEHNATPNIRLRRRAHDEYGYLADRQLGRPPITTRPPDIRLTQTTTATPPPSILPPPIYYPYYNTEEIRSERPELTRL